ncbi:MAG: hypothetical protein Q8L88_14205 [Bacteroidota bacterium]|nr:hypothetical protein [Bacteroidota bacterium]
MNQLNNTDITLEIANPEISNGFVHLLSTSTIFAMDLIGKNLQMNGINTQWSYSDVIDVENGPSKLYVKKEQQEQALSILTSLDLLDFTIQNGK